MIFNYANNTLLDMALMGNGGFMVFRLSENIYEY